MTVKLCKDCFWSRERNDGYRSLYCVNPEVNAKDSYALSQVTFYGSECRSEREKKSSRHVV